MEEKKANQGNLPSLLSITFETVFRKLSILSKNWKWNIQLGVGVHVICVTMTHCVRNRYLTHPLKNC